MKYIRNYLHTCPFKVFLNSQPLSVNFKKVIVPLLSPIKQCLEAVSYTKQLVNDSTLYEPIRVALSVE